MRPTSSPSPLSSLPLKSLFPLMASTSIPTIIRRSIHSSDHLCDSSSFPNLTPHRPISIWIFFNFFLWQWL
ncbi:hypothetical protein L6452_00347 [Arctium lappa]|uniref:Uncharacterized protein n=1 Tax=Arctium lappa TaxID=4217 RepID=A0ACB9FEG1_ARCLA|nr:hypothetical protein L6452_00347 [Arctium lappa]